MKEYPKWTSNNGRVIVNERCYCGKLRTQHLDNHPIYAQGHGPCPETGCKRYTYKSFVYERRKAA